MPAGDYLNETDARIVIDDLLRRAGWDPSDKSQVLTEVSTKSGVAETVATFTATEPYTAIDADDIPSGKADYVLLGVSKKL